ncbi:S8 family serine peptidase [Chelatococcus sambhunathii]|uniref:S8 family serine peptidase n=1 Tax=Chelatococcus sambhunathii TaxID=363953 RepID=A0ABU1DE49_9HYPH|nr:S8 family serine peptidase [Chelatococcus sambhunathii]MDR4306376.1 S8 family serine peptidase [Chelatococcus sambhunathii]
MLTGSVEAAGGRSERDAAVATLGKAPAPNDPGAATLREKAAAPGGVRVFVKLAVALQSEDKLGEAEAEDQARTLAAAQDGLVTRALGGGQARHRLRTYRYVPYVAVTVNAAELDRLLADGGVLWVGEVGVRTADAGSLPWGVDKIEAKDVWDRGHEGQSVTIAVLDAGMQAKHPMLAANVVEEMCYSTMDPANFQKTLCPNGKEKMTGPGSSKNCPVSYGDDCRHGTHVAGIAGGGAWSGLIGVAPKANLILGQVFTESTKPGDTGIGAYDDDIISGLERVYSLRKKYTIAAVNMSLGGGKYNGACDTDGAAFVDIFRLLREAKIAPLVASGNEYFSGYIGKPACVSGAIAVGATNRNDEVTDFSNHSQLVKLLAPGDDIVSAAPGNAKATMSGTSQATPHVSGAFAILRDAVPGASVAEIQRALECTGKAVEAAGIRKRRINVPDALEVLTSGTNRPKVFDFDEKSDAKAWKPLPGSTWKVAGGAYVPVFSDTNYSLATSFTPNCNSDLDLRVDLKGMGNNQGVYIYVKTQIDKTGKLFSGYSFYFDSWFYEKKWMTFHSFTRYDQYDSTTGFGHIEYIYGDCGLPASGPVDSVEIKIRGAQFTVVEDGKTVKTIKDLTYTTGGVGLAVSSPYEEPNAIRIDAVTIRSRDKPLDEKDPAPAVAEAPEPAPTLLKQISDIKVPQC